MLIINKTKYFLNKLYEFYFKSVWSVILYTIIFFVSGYILGLIVAFIYYPFIQAYNALFCLLGLLLFGAVFIQPKTKLKSLLFLIFILCPFYYIYLDGVRFTQERFGVNYKINRLYKKISIGTLLDDAESMGKSDIYSHYWGIYCGRNAPLTNKLGVCRS